MKKNNRTRKKIYCQNYEHLDIEFGFFNINPKRKLKKIKAEYYVQYQDYDYYGYETHMEIIQVCKYCADDWKSSGEGFVWKFKDDWKIKVTDQINMEIEARNYEKEVEFHWKNLKEEGYI